ncbi:hypothetical protein Taro_018082, partial [Colocasia esculenta]|nr:hypothetical protein [Colocasia esculenta]
SGTKLDDGLELSFTDKRRFARVRLLQDPGSTPPISELGPDALLEPMELDEFVKSLSSKKTPIKALLLDQARIHPLQTAASLSREKCEVLHKCIKEVLEKALEVGADSTQFPSKKIEFIRVGGRTTAFVPELQKLDGDTSGKASGAKSRNSRSVKLSGDEVASNTKEDDDREDEVGEDKGSRLKSKSVKSLKSQGAGGTTKKLSTKRSTRANSDDEEESETEGEREKEESDMEKKGSTRKPKPKKGKSTTGAVKSPPAKKETRSAPEKGGAQKKKMVREAVKEQPEVKEKAVSTKRTKAEQTSAQQAKKRRR